MITSHVTRRQRASRVPGITGIRLTPIGGVATLVNISSSGVLVVCRNPVAARMRLTIAFEGTFSPASVEGRVVRCGVAGIGKDGALSYHVAIAFTDMIPLDLEPVRSSPEPRVPSAAHQPLPDEPILPTPPAPPRNRW